MRKVKKASKGNFKAVERSVQQLSVIVMNISDGSVSGLHFLKFPTKNPAKACWCNLIKRQHRRDRFHVSENTVICEKHFRKHEIIKGAGGVWSRLGKGMVFRSV